MNILERSIWKDNDGAGMSTDRRDIPRAQIYQFDEQAMADIDYHPTYQKGPSEADTVKIATLNASRPHNAVTYLHHRYCSGFYMPAN
jgi:hypothetical protein